MDRKDILTKQERALIENSHIPDRFLNRGHPMWFEVISAYEHLVRELEGLLTEYKNADPTYTDKE